MEKEAGIGPFYLYEQLKSFKLKRGPKMSDRASKIELVQAQARPLAANPLKRLSLSPEFKTNERAFQA